MICNNSILEEDITFILQGAIYKVGNKNYTKELVESIKSKHPKSTVILSINSDEDVDFGQDLLLNCKDVGSIKVPGLKDLNVNRQIYSTLQGLKSVKTTWVCKLRTDIVYGSHIDYEKLYGNYQRDPLYTVFEERLLVTDITTKNFSYCDTYINHVCDWFYFGKTTDLYRVFDIPLYTLREFPLIAGKHQFAAEVYIWTRHLIDREAFYSDSCKYLVNNAIIINSKKLGISSGKKGYKIPFGVNGYAQWNHIDWLTLYNKYFKEDARKVNKRINLISKLLYKAYYKLFFVPALYLYKFIFND